MTVIFTLPLLVAIFIVIRNRKFINKFRDTNTTSTETAKTLEELNVGKWILFAKLNKSGVLVEVGGDITWTNKNSLNTKEERG
jgi:hypothetical protein